MMTRENVFLIQVESLEEKGQTGFFSCFVYVLEKVARAVSAAVKRLIVINNLCKMR